MRPIDTTCPKCSEGPGNSCRDLRFDKRSPSKLVLACGGLHGFHGVVRPHRERVAKAVQTTTNQKGE